MKVIVCDLCKKIMDKNYKIKKPFNWFGYASNFDGGEWSKLDVCDDCKEAFIEFLKIRNLL